MKSSFRIHRVAMAALLACCGPASAVVCVVPDDGTGTAELPPNCPGGYQSPDDVHMIIDGLPPGTTIIVDASHAKFGLFSSGPGGSLGGEYEQFNSFLFMELTGTGGLAGFNRFASMQLQCETHIGPRIHGNPVQSFPTDMFMLQGQLPPGDPDFDLLRITAGSAFGMPSPGHTTVRGTADGNLNWLVDSFFDITYRIDFVGAPGGPLAGMSGSTTGTIRMGVGDPPAEACCLTDGACRDLRPSFCSGIGGVPLGAGTSCATHGPTCDSGACCRPGGGCTMGTKDDCTGFVCDVHDYWPPSWAGCYADADGNGVVNPGDRGVISANIGQTNRDLVCLNDMDGNGTINAGDRGFVSANIGGCAALPNYQNGSGLNFAGTGPDPRFPSGLGHWEGYGTTCADPDACRERDYMHTIAQLIVQIPPGSPPMSILMEGTTSSDTIVERRGGPYLPGEMIDTEIVQLELEGFGPFGPMRLHEDPARPSPGSVQILATDAGGELAGGNSFFDVFVTLEAPQFNMQLHTNQPVPMFAGSIQELPPSGAVYHKFSDLPIPFFNQDGNYVGDLIDVFHFIDPCDCPDDADLAGWNDGDGTEFNNNCYNYGTNQKTGTYAQPGAASGAPIVGSPTCANTAAAAGSDAGAGGPLPAAAPGPPPTCPAGSCLVALVIDPDDPGPDRVDYHWYRKNDDGTWSHKMASNPATTNDESGAAITDPETADRDGYTVFCGYFCVPWDMVVVRSAPDDDGTRGVPGLAGVSILNRSGLEPPGWNLLTPAQVSQIRSRLTGLPPTPNPAWPSLLSFNGFAIERGTDTTLPNYVRVWNGVIRITNGSDVRYYLDVNGLESYLTQEAINRGLGGELP